MKVLDAVAMRFILDDMNLAISVLPANAVYSRILLERTRETLLDAALSDVRVETPMEPA